LLRALPRALCAGRGRLAKTGVGPPEIRELIDADVPADELERLARVDGLLRVAAARVGAPDEASGLWPRATFRDRGASACSGAGGRNRIHQRRRCTSGEAVRRRSSLGTTPPATTGSTWHRRDRQTHELRLSFGELAVIYKSLQAAKTLGALPPQDELLSDTIQRVDQALNTAI
jgi:hypothetical protein